MIHETDVCIVGGGPAGMVLGLLLAKLGRKVLVLEQHQDFHREYRGEVLMPRFTQMARQINLYDHIEKYPHLKLKELEGFYKDRLILRVGFTEIAPEVPFAIWMPQPILLGALFDKAKTYPAFNLWFGARVEHLIEENGITKGIVVVKDGQHIEARAKVTVGTDGRFSIVRKRGRFELADEDHRFDVIWFSIPKPPEYDNRVRFFLSSESSYLILPKHPDSIQCGLLVKKGGYSDYLKRGIDSMRQVLLKSHPLMHDFAKQLRDFSPFSVLQAKIELVKKWASDGVLLVGDSAHTCSPAGAIGVSVAVASAIVAAEVIDDCLKKGDVSAKALGRLQELREKEVKEILWMQKTFSSILFPTSKWLRPIMLVVLVVAGRIGLFRLFQRNLMVASSPLPVSERIKL